MEDSGPTLVFTFVFYGILSICSVSFRGWTALNISPGFPQFHMLTSVGSAESWLFTNGERSQGVAHRDVLTLPRQLVRSHEIMQNEDVWVYFLLL